MPPHVISPPAAKKRAALAALALFMATSLGMPSMTAQAATTVTVPAATNAANVNGAPPAAATDNAALEEAAVAAAAVAASPELHGAVTSSWRTAWQMAWPFIKTMTLKFFGLFGTAWQALSAPAPAANVNGVNSAINADASVNAAATE